MTGINIDALLGEVEDKTLTFKGKTFTLPAELPGSTLAPFLNEDLGLADLLADTLADAGDDDNLIDLAFEALRKQPRLPLAVLEAAKVAFRDLLGDDQYAEFVALKPSVPALMLIGREVVSAYAVSLTDFFSSSAPSDSDGTDSKQTSPTTTPDSTPEASGDAQEPTAS